MTSFEEHICAIYFNKATSRVRIAARVHVFERQTAGEKSECIRKVLRQASSVNVFPWFSSASEQMMN